MKNSMSERIATMEQSLRNLNSEHGETRDMLKDYCNKNDAAHAQIMQQLSDIKSDVATFNTKIYYVIAFAGAIGGVLGAILTKLIG